MLLDTGAFYGQCTKTLTTLPTLPLPRYLVCCLLGALFLFLCVKSDLWTLFVTSADEWTPANDVCMWDRIA